MRQNSLACAYFATNNLYATVPPPVIAYTAKENKGSLLPTKMRFIAPMAFLSAAGLRASWRPSTLQTSLVPESNPDERASPPVAFANPSRSTIGPIDISTTLQTRRKWIQCAVLPPSTILIMSSAAKAALANDNSVNPVNPNDSQTRFVSPFRPWLKVEDKSSQGGDSDESSNGKDDSSSSAGGSSVSSD